MRVMSEEQSDMIQRASQEQMTAEKARALTAKGVSIVDYIGLFTARIDRRIQLAASRAESCVESPFAGSRRPPSDRERLLVREYYVKLGFTWHQNETISW